MTDLTTRPSIAETMRSNWGWLLGLGIVFILAGLFAFAMPLASTLAVTIVVAIALIVAGIVQIIQAWRMRSWGDFAWQLLIGIVILVGGIGIYLNPVAGTLALTLIAGAAFIAKGVFQIVLGIRLRPMSNSWWIVAAGVIALLVGLMILSDWPFSAAYAPGVLAGISLAFTGWSYVALAFAARRM
jgi:uncharacterized membrane protein HdeD (DUF308 family)